MDTRKNSCYRQCYTKGSDVFQSTDFSSEMVKYPEENTAAEKDTLNEVKV